MKLALPVETINATLDYLATKPYREVMHLIPAIQAATPVEEKTPDHEEIEHAADS